MSGAQARSMANPHRGEGAVRIAGHHYVLRPTFTALVAAEDELGPLFALVERAGDGQLKLAELAALFWHCLPDGHCLERSAVNAAVAEMGLAGAAKPLRVLLKAILQGSA